MSDNPIIEGEEKATGVPFFGLRIPIGLANGVFAAGVVLGQVGENVTLPMFNEALGHNHHIVDPWFVLVWIQIWVVVFFSIVYGYYLVFKPQVMARQKGEHKTLLLLGFLSNINGVMVVFASNPDRTAPFLQAVLGNFLIPMVILFRWLILKKKPNWKQLVCAGAVLLGLFICLIPTIFNIDQTPSHSAATGAARILWPMCFMVGFAPYAIMYVVNERMLKEASQDPSRDPIHIIRFLFWLFFYQILVSVLTFWLDLIPGFGNAKNIHQFGENMVYGAQCSLGMADCGYNAALRGGLFITFFVLAYAAGALLVKYAEGATWAAIVQALVTPLGTIWWTLFQESPFKWHPLFLPTTWYTVGALFLLVPAIVFYQIFAREPPKSPQSEPLLSATLDDDESDFPHRIQA